MHVSAGSPLSLNILKLSLLTEKIRFLMIKYKIMLIFWSFKESRVNTKLLRMCSTNLGLDTCGSGLHSVWYKESLWKCSVGTNRNVVCLCGFLSPPRSFFSTEIGPLVKRHLCFLLSFQDWMSWFRTHKCNFNFDCLLVYFMHLLSEEGETGF